MLAPQLNGHYPGPHPSLGSWTAQRGVGQRPCPASQRRAHREKCWRNRQQTLKLIDDRRAACGRTMRDIQGEMEAGLVFKMCTCRFFSLLCCLAARRYRRSEGSRGNSLMHAAVMPSSKIYLRAKSAIPQNMHGERFLDTPEFFGSFLQGERTMCLNHRSRLQVFPQSTVVTQSYTL